MSKNKKGIICIILAAFFFASMNVFVKLSGDVPSIQKSFFRNFVAAIFSLIILLKNGHNFHYHKKDVPLLLLRSSCGTLGILGNFYAVDHLLVADASLLGKLAPFFAIIASAFILKEKPNWIQRIVIIIAFIGALFVIKPSLNFASNVASLAGIIGAFGAGVAYTCVRILGKNGVPGPKIVFFFSCFSCLVVTPYILLNYSPMTLQQLLMLIGAGLMACGGQFAVTAAYTYAPAKEISVYDYTQIIFAAILGFIFLNQIPDSYSFLGYIIILCAGIINFIYNKKL